MDQVNRKRRVREYFSKYEREEALALAVEHLFLCLGRKSNPGSVDVFVGELADIETPLLIAGFSEASRTTKDWLTPGMIRELCLGGSQADLDAAAADEAWAWVLKYVKDHGPLGRTKPGAVTFHPDKEPTYALDVPAPKIPLAIKDALVAIGGDLTGGLSRVAQATNSELVFIKREFTAAYGRARRLVC